MVRFYAENAKNRLLAAPKAHANIHIKTLPNICGINAWRWVIKMLEYQISCKSVECKSSCSMRTDGRTDRQTFTYLLAQWSRVLLEKLTGSAASQEIPRIYGTRKFITAFTSARHLSLSWANSIQSITPHPTSCRPILLLSSHHLRLGLPSSLFPSGFPTKTLYMPLLSPIRATCPAHLIPLEFITQENKY